MAKQSTTLVLRRDGRTVSTLEMKPGCEDVFIGRSHACTLRTPEDDRSVSGRHVHVFWKGTSIFLEDAGSSNGIYIQGKRIAKPLKMKPGQPVSFGNFQLSLSEHVDSKKDKNAKKYHALELLNGDHAGKTVERAEGERKPINNHNRRGNFNNRREHRGDKPAERQSDHRTAEGQNEHKPAPKAEARPAEKKPIKVANLQFLDAMEAKVNPAANPANHPRHNTRHFGNKGK